MKAEEVLNFALKISGYDRSRICLSGTGDVFAQNEREVAQPHLKYTTHAWLRDAEHPCGCVLSEPSAHANEAQQHAIDGIELLRTHPWVLCVLHTSVALTQVMRRIL